MSNFLTPKNVPEVKKYRDTIVYGPCEFDVKPDFMEHLHKLAKSKVEVEKREKIAVLHDEIKRIDEEILQLQKIKDAEVGAKWISVLTEEKRTLELRIKEIAKETA
jgi:hypothetical protein